jgi:3-hydroxyisobutyrate dehydrogenase
MPALDDGKIVVDTSTIDPDVERAARTCDGDRALPGGPAIGRHRGRRAGHAHADGGRNADVLAAAPPLRAVRGTIVHVGGPGTGQIVKLCNNLLYAAQMLATAEATTMAAKAGVDLRAARGHHALDR